MAPTMVAVAPLVALALVTLLFAKYYFSPAPSRPTRSVVLLVLGDMGRSPRMMYHAQSFADNGFQTTLVGYAGSSLLPSLLSMPNFHTIPLTPPPNILLKAPRSLFLLTAPLKVLMQVAGILKVLLWELEDPPEFVLVQNPPSIPTLALVQLVVLLRGSRLIIDWHNLGFSILAMRLGKDHLLVRVAKKFERTFGRTAFVHLFVTKAMEEWLTKEWGLRGQKIVLHDRPPEHFRPCGPVDVHNLFSRLQPLLPKNVTSLVPKPNTTTSTTFTDLLAPSSISPTHLPTPHLRSDRPAVLVSSTSWTADEDFSILLDALTLYELEARKSVDRTFSESVRLPPLAVVVSGKGPGRRLWEAQVEKRRLGEGWKFVGVWCAWVEVEDYPRLLGSADLGVSLHSSSSALDLPMKIVDMFGCGLPVCSLDFACLNELVEDGVNGLIFSTSSQLAFQIISLLRGFPSSSDSAQLQKIRSKISERQQDWGTWSQNWDRVLRPSLIKGSRGVESELDDTKAMS
ncbi:hypothetical protein BDY24DRAFT_381314 [Mrakia frigida]|uniref:chitobiosyldiphosphodolichol beta-1,4 mannosyltransferase n=1 Tax=Mrakia frigida TaxID=29902 RepID=UPI003FCC1FA2